MKTVVGEGGDRRHLWRGRSEAWVPDSRSDRLAFGLRPRNGIGTAIHTIGVPPELQSVASKIDRCMLTDRRRLRRRLRAWERSGGGRSDLEAIAEAVDRSARRLEDRTRGLPGPTFDQDLPIHARRSDIAEAIRANQVVVVCGATGSGKSTQLPKICLSLGRGASGMIGHTQPRRIAARSLAARIAEELATAVGGSVGYKVRFGDRTSPDTFIKLMTDGILLAETQGDRSLDQYDTIIIDEAHERSLNIDFLLGYIRQLLPRRPELKVIITSATIDPQRFSEHFGGAPVIEVSGRTYPVEVRYRPLANQEPDKADRELPEGIAQAVDELAEEGPGDFLVFLPGEREIREAAEELRKHHPPETEILPLFARLSVAEQNRVFQPHARRRIVLATNVAETSLTVPGIRYVVDSGLARISRYSHRSRVQQLPVEAISQASAEQRSGRCGRVAEGVCIRLYSRDDLEQREPFTPPEILRTSLASVILRMKALKLGPVEDFPFLEPPDRRMVREGYQTLWELGALTENTARARLTELGRRMARLPIDPRISRMVLAAEKEDCLGEVLIIASALSIQDPRERPFDRRELADEAHARFRAPGSDFLAFVKLWNEYHEKARHLSRNKLRAWCKASFLSHSRMREWHDTHAQLKAMISQMGYRVHDREAGEDQIHRALLTGLLGNVGRKGPGYDYQGAGGVTFNIFPGSALFAEKPRWVVAAELVRTTKLYARTVARIEPAWLEELAGHLVKRSYAEPYWDRAGARVMACETVTLFGLEVVSRRRVHYGPVDPPVARELFIRNALVRGDYRARGKYAAHNRDLTRRVLAMEDRLRRPILVDEGVRYLFFDRIVPPDVCNGARFERWRKRAEREDPDVLFYRQEDLVAGADLSELARFPDELEVSGVGRLPLSYVNDHAHRADGVTMHVPVAALGQIPEHIGQWLVPGLLREKVLSLIRGLPKAYRRLVDAEAFAAGFVAARRAEGPVMEELSGYFESATGLRPPNSAWAVSDLPDYLRMNYVIVDDTGRELAQGRDLAVLRESLTKRIAESLARVAESEYNRDGLEDWDFQELPQRVEVSRDGVRIEGFPALVDRGASVSLRLMPASGTAARATRAGVRRLFMLRYADELRRQTTGLPGFDEMALAYATVGTPTQFRRDLAALIADRVFLASPPYAPQVRTRDEFARRIDEAWNRLGSATDEAVDVAGRVLSALQNVRAELGKGHPHVWAEALADMDQQVGHLAYRGFLAETPWEWLRQYPRYLSAILVRLRRLGAGGLERDNRVMLELAPHWRVFLAHHDRVSARGVVDPELERLGWMLQEWRVSLFAQELRTVIPVSEKRIRQQWGRVGR